jgi:polyisoprenoid-binding protein YceI
MLPEGEHLMTDKLAAGVRSASRPATTWKIDPSHTTVGFAVRHLMISTVRGRFADVAGSVTVPDDDFRSAQVDVTIGTASVDTRDAQRDTHLRSADFFDAEHFPAMTFTSRRVDTTPHGYALVGDLTIRGVTREVSLAVTEEGRGSDPWGGVRAGFSATATINRRDFGLTWNAALETGGVLVGDEVKIGIDLELIAQHAIVDAA